MVAVHMYKVAYSDVVILGGGKYVVLVGQDYGH